MIHHFELSLMQTAPDTHAYFLAGMAVIFGMILIYQLSIMVRLRSAQKRLRKLQERQAGVAGENS